MPFAIQTIDGEIAFDFGFQLNQFVKTYPFHNFKVTLSDVPIVDHIPIGSVEFVHSSMKLHGFDIPPPINIPKVLNQLDIVNRKVYYTNQRDLIEVGSFVKSMTKIKDGFTGILYSESIKNSLPEDEYLVSEFLDFSSEWRAFVLDGEIQDFRRYSGNYDEIPRPSDIHFIVDRYLDPPIAYTLDIGIYRGETSLIEIHNFYSCGLYGFSIKNAFRMWAEWWNSYCKSEIIKKRNKHDF